MQDDTGSSAMDVDRDQAEGKPDPMPVDSDARSDASFDPLFDDVPEELSKPQVKDSRTIISDNSQPHGRPPPPAKPPPQGAPPLLDPAEFSSYSPELLMTAFIDGQVILWDRRASTSGNGVGRLWMSDKTPPWCLSVSAIFQIILLMSDFTPGMLVS
jgi:transcriptional activator SPT8